MNSCHSGRVIKEFICQAGLRDNLKWSSLLPVIPENKNQSFRTFITTDVQAKGLYWVMSSLGTGTMTCFETAEDDSQIEECVEGISEDNRKPVGAVWEDIFMTHCCDPGMCWPPRVRSLLTNGVGSWDAGAVAVTCENFPIEWTVVNPSGKVVLIIMSLVWWRFETCWTETET